MRNLKSGMEKGKCLFGLGFKEKTLLLRSEFCTDLTAKTSRFCGKGTDWNGIVLYCCWGEFEKGRVLHSSL